MYAGTDFDPHDGTEIEPYEFDFSRDLQPIEVITQTAWSIAVVTGTDAQASSRFNGAPQIDPTGTKTSQQFAYLLNSCLYRLAASVTTNLGNVRELWSHAPGVPPN